MFRSSMRAAHCDWSHSYDVEVETEEGTEVLTVRSIALRPDIVFDSEMPPPTTTTKCVSLRLCQMTDARTTATSTPTCRSRRRGRARSKGAAGQEAWRWLALEAQPEARRLSGSTKAAPAHQRRQTARELHGSTAHSRHTGAPLGSLIISRR